MERLNIEQEKLLADDTVNESDETRPHGSMKLENFSFKSFSAKVNWYVFFLISLFTLGSWIDIAGIWSELTFMVDELPEGWRLPSILTASSQISQIGPIIFMLVKYRWPHKLNNVVVIYGVFITGVISCFMLTFFWHKTVTIGHEERSLFLYIFNFTLSFLDGMSTLLFLPYVGEYFAKEYIISNYIGESMSSLIPGLLAMAQGFGDEDTACTNVSSSNSNTTLSNQVKTFRPVFSVSVYYFLMLVILLVSILAFTVLHFSKTARAARKTSLNDTSSLVDRPESATNLAFEKETDVDSNNNEIMTDVQLNDEPLSVRPTDFKYRSNDRFETKFLLSLAFLVSFIYYGFLPGLVSYSTMPYSRTWFHLSVNLSSIFLPFVIIATIWSYEVSLGQIAVETLISTAISVYILIISILSPCPPFHDQKQLGGLIITIGWILSSCLYMRIRCLIATRLEKHGQQILLLIGFFTIMGQVLGGLIIYLCVDVYRLFKDKPACVSEDFCVNRHH